MLFKCKRAIVIRGMVLARAWELFFGDRWDGEMGPVLREITNIVCALPHCFGTFFIYSHFCTRRSFDFVLFVLLNRASFIF